MKIEIGELLSPLNLRVVAAVGLLGRALSELKGLALDEKLDASDRQTVKHHAEDCAGLCSKILEILAAPALSRWTVALGPNWSCGGSGGGGGGGSADATGAGAEAIGAGAEEAWLAVGARVRKRGATHAERDYAGRVVSAFSIRGGAGRRYVVEDDYGVLRIYSDVELTPA